MRLVLLALSLLLSACGQAGDLYLPSDPVAAPVPSPASPPAAPANDPAANKKDAH